MNQFIAKFIAISENAVININQIVLITTEDEESILVLMADGTDLTFPKETARTFLQHLPTSSFYCSPKLWTIRDNFSDPQLNLKLNLGQEDCQLQIGEHTLNNCQILSLTIEDNALRIVLADFQIIVIDKKQEIIDFLNKFSVNSLPCKVANYLAYNSEF